MIVVDSGIWIDFFCRKSPDRPSTLARLIEADADIVTGDLVYLEVLRGFRSDADMLRAKSALDAFDTVRIIDKDIALEAAQIYRALRRQGITIRKSADLIIATFCLRNNAQLLHNDHDYNPLEELFGLRTLAP